MPHIATVTLSSTAPYGQSRAHEAPKLPRETPDAYEERTWRQKAHVDGQGRVVIPAMAFKQALDKAAKMLGKKIPGRGNSTYSAFFKSGQLVLIPN